MVDMMFKWVVTYARALAAAVTLGSRDEDGSAQEEYNDRTSGLSKRKTSNEEANEHDNHHPWGEDRE